MDHYPLRQVITIVIELDVSSFALNVLTVGRIKRFDNIYCTESVCVIKVNQRVIIK